MIRPIPLMMSVVLLASAAQAADPAANEAAKKHFTRSKELYDDGDFAASLNELERSYQAVPNYKLLYNMGQIQAQLQNHAGALRSFRRFLSEGGNEIIDARRGEVLKEIDKLRTRVSELTITVSQPGAEISVDDVVVGTSPLSDPITVNAGKRKVSATLPDYFPATKQVDVVGLETPRLALELRPLVTSSATSSTTAAPAEAVKVEPSKPFRLPVWVPWAGTVVLAGGTAVTAVLANQASQKQTALLKTYGVTRPQLDAASASTRNLALTTDILAGVTGAAAVGSLLFTLLRAPEPASAATTVQVGVGPNSLVVSGSF